MNESLVIELIKISLQTAFLLGRNWEGVFFDWEKRLFYVHYYGYERLTVPPDWFFNLRRSEVFVEAVKRLEVRKEARVVD